ncbi:MAG: hypothetical protein WA277_00965 [Nitrospirota bacterium]
MRFTIILAFLIIFYAVQPSAFSQSDEVYYRPSTISAFINATRSAENGDFTYSIKVLGAEAKVIYLGEIRPIEGGKRKLIDGYFVAINRRELASLFKHELLVGEGENQYWLPIEERLINRFRVEIKSNSQVLLAFSWLGTVKTQSGREWVLAVRRFKKAT